MPRNDGFYGHLSIEKAIYREDLAEALRRGCDILNETTNYARK